MGGEARPWTRGFFAFDPSWVHAAANDGETDRFVLLLQPLRDDVRDEDVAAVAHYLHPDVHPPGGSEYPFWLRWTRSSTRYSITPSFLQNSRSVIHTWRPP